MSYLGYIIAAIMSLLFFTFNINRYPTSLRSRVSILIEADLMYSFANPPTYILKFQKGD